MKKHSIFTRIGEMRGKDQIEVRISYIYLRRSAENNAKYFILIIIRYRHYFCTCLLVLVKYSSRFAFINHLFRYFFKTKLLSNIMTLIYFC